MGFGKLKKRDETKLMGTDKERTLYNIENNEYYKLGKYCLEQRISVDLFVFNNDYYDLSSIGYLSSITGGSIYYYPTFDPN